MGFFEGLGSFLGEMAGKAEEHKKQAELYRPEYEGLSNRTLIEKRKALRQKSDAESKARSLIIWYILKERGVIE